MDDMTVFASIGLLVAILIWLLVFRRRQSVRLSGDTPVRPHMAHKQQHGDASAQTGNAAKLGDLPRATGAPDDLQQLKGVGPKMATMLNDMGISRFDQIAALSAPQITEIDDQLGAFKGRFERDRIVEQADYLGRGDIDGYEAKFGKL